MEGIDFLVKILVFVRFLEELRIPKSSFEVNRPLDTSLNS